MSTTPRGARIARGTLASAPSSYTATCAPPVGSGFTLTNCYLVDLSGNQVTELTGQAGSQTWLHSNVWLAGRLSATWDGKAIHFELADPLGTKRLQANALGQIDNSWTSLPFGNDLNNPPTYSTPDATEHHFTGKERDSESGNDYFGKRYYASSMGRWMSPDRINVTEDRMMNPANTLNKYAYGANNPLKYVDPDGQDITIYYEAGNPFPGHTMLLAYNQQTGDSATRSFGPDHSSASVAQTAVGLPVPGTDRFGLDDIKSPDDLRKNFASITIQTTPEEAQEVIDAIRANPDGNYTTYWNNCTTTCSKLLRAIGKTSSHAVTPISFFNELYGEQTGLGTGRSPRSFPNGQDYGKPRYDPFQMFFWLMGSNDKSSVTTTSTNCVTDSNGQKHCDSQ